jgi:hypothetical protein
MKPYFLIALVVFGVYVLWPEQEIPRAAGVLAPDEPYQKELSTSSFINKNGYRIAPLAAFDIRARVISSSRYRFDREADLAPVDLVLGWGPMSDSDVLKQITFTQNMRAYRWQTKSFPVTRRVIEIHSANMHMIPANAEIESQLKSIRPGNMVHLKGHLVEVTSKEGWRWKSSLTRTDTGFGACELILVESLYIW